MLDTHKFEIATTRVGGFGGSDAAMLARLASGNPISKTTWQRLMVACGYLEPQPFIGNEATNAGHMFEEYIGTMLPAAEREYLLEQPLSNVFRTFAHADFWIEATRTVLECKFSQHVPDKVLQTYRWQLQWYYLLGAERVVLVYGTGDKQPFKVDDVKMIDVAPDGMMHAALLRGLRAAEEWRADVAEDDIVNVFATNDTTCGA